MGAQEQHSRIAPSSAGVWGKCPASIIMQENDLALKEADVKALQQNPNADREGDATHWLAAYAMTTGKGVFPESGTMAPNGFIVTREMLDCARIFVELIMGRDIPHSIPHIEEKVHAPLVHAESWGSVDHWTYDSRGQGTIYVDDFKYGYGLVEVFHNWQMINYALGALNAISANTDWSISPAKICMTIVQPRPYHEDGSIRSWTITAAELIGYAMALSEAAHKALGPSPEVVSGPHCRYCRARHACPAAHRAAMSAIDVTMGATIKSLDPEVLDREITLLRRVKSAIEYRLAGVEAQAMAAMKNGVIIPGWKAAPGQGRDGWNTSVEEVFIMGEMNGVDLRKNEAITPKQAVDAGLSPDLVALYRKAGEGKMKLVPEDGARAKEVFGKESK